MPRFTNTLAVAATAALAFVGAVRADCETDEDCNGAEICDDAICRCLTVDEQAFECFDGPILAHALATDVDEEARPVCIDFAKVNDGYCDCPNCDDERRDDCDGPDGCGGGDGEGGVGDWPTDEGDSSGTGDPHFRSFDGMYFDFQGLGEFRFCQTATTVVNTCQAPWVHNPSGAAVNRAVTVQAGGTTVSLAYIAATGTFDAFANGAALAAGAGFSDENLTATPQGGGGLLITTSAGDVVSLRTSSWAQWIDVEFRPAAGASTTGLCGTNNGDISDDWTGGDGTVYPTSGISWYDVNQAAEMFGESWRAATSLLPAGAGECPGSAEGFQSVDILGVARGFDGGDRPADVHGAKKGRRLTREMAEHVRSTTTMSFEVFILLADNIENAAGCLADTLGVSLDELEARAFAGTADSVRIWQMLYDLIFFTLDNTSDNETEAPLDPATCGAGHRLLESFLTSAIPEPGTGTGEVYTAFCDPSTSAACNTASTTTSAGNTVSIIWRPDGSCPK